MSCDCQAQCSSPGPWSIIIGDSFSQYFNITNGCPPQSVGDNTWGAEFGIVAPNNPTQFLFRTTTADNTNQLFWSQAGQLTLMLKQATTQSFASYLQTLYPYNWYLAVTAPSAFDTAGFRTTVAQGSVMFKQPGQQCRDELVYGRRIPCPAGANVDNYCGFGYGYGPYAWGYPYVPLCR